MCKSVGLSWCVSDGITRAGALMCLLALTSCGSNEDKKQTETSSAAVPAKNVKPEAKKAETVASAPVPVNAGDSELLRPYQLDNLAAPLALVKVPGKPDSQGVLLQGGTRISGSGRDYVLICEAPEGTESVNLVFKSSSQLAYSSAKRISSLPSGLSVFGFSTNSSVRTCKLVDPPLGDTFHAIRIAGEGELADEQLAAVQEQIKGVHERIAEAQQKLDEAMRPPARQTMVPPQRGGAQNMMSQMQQERSQRMRAMDAASRELDTLKGEERSLTLGMDFCIASLKAAEVAAFSSRDIKQKDAALLEGTILVSSSGAVVAIRCMGNWVDLMDEVESSGQIIRQADINVSGGERQLSVSCELHPFLPTSSAKFVMVAETTHGLETRGSGSIEERLSTVEPVPFQSSGSNFRVQQQVEWAGTKTKLWLKVFNPAEPDKLILDEVISLDYPGRLLARWDKEPSAIISIPPAEPDQPEDLVSVRKTLDAKGAILDIVAAGDGSVLVIRTDREPYLTLLDLKTGEWLPAPWKATEKTLVATQTGKIHLFDSESMVVETWGLESGKREGLQILQLTDPILAVAAPLSDAGQPLLVATAKGAWFLDPVKFETVACGLDARRFFSDGLSGGDLQQPLELATMSVRASSDGTLYSLSCRRAGATGRAPERITVCLDRTPMVVRTESDGFIGSKGRDLVRSLPDHGGRGLAMSPTISGARFPGSTGEIRMTHPGMGGTVALIRNPPVLPEESAKTAGPLPVDRGAYLDSENSVLLIPDGEKLHYMRLSLPEIPKSAPAFLLAGEPFEIPLPPGTEHRLTSSGEAGTSEITTTHARWIVPESGREATHRLKLEWIGELGSTISSNHNVRIVPASAKVEVESPDGSRKISLPRRGILSNMQNSIGGFAGSGAIAFSGSGERSAWNLWTCERIFSTAGNPQVFFGDADHFYELNRERKLISYDIQTGRKLAEEPLGQEVQTVATGIASRGPLLAVEQNGGEGYLLQISRDTLKSEIVDLPVELRRRLFSPSLAVNATGSAAWTRRGIGIFRDGRAITVTPFPTDTADQISGVPDISGKFIVDRRQILNIADKPPVIMPIPGMDDSTQPVMDATGRYFLFHTSQSSEQTQIVSVRGVADPSRELFKIRYRRGFSGQQPMLAAGAKALLISPASSGSAHVYELDVSAIANELSN